MAFCYSSVSPCFRNGQIGPFRQQQRNAFLTPTDAKIRITSCTNYARVAEELIHSIRKIFGFYCTDPRRWNP